MDILRGAWTLIIYVTSFRITYYCVVKVHSNNKLFQIRPSVFEGSVICDIVYTSMTSVFCQIIDFLIQLKDKVFSLSVICITTSKDLRSY